MNLLLEATRSSASRIYVVLTMRSDFLGDCAQFHNLPEALNRGQYLIPRMKRDDRRAAIEGPVAVGNATITPRLVQTLLNDVGEDPDQLPVLQHALMRTWEDWRDAGLADQPIDLQHYKSIGELKHALSMHADEAYGELTDDRQRMIAKRLFQRLCERTVDRRETRHPSRLADICAVCGASLDEAVTVIDRFRTGGRTFLLPDAQTILDANSVIDISHEALIRQWGQLREWADEEADAAGMFLRVADAARRYQDKKAGLWRDLELQSAQLWRRQRVPTEAWAQRYHVGFAAAMAFLDASRRAQHWRGAGKVLLPAIIALLVAAGAAGWRISKDNLALIENQRVLKAQAGELESRRVDLKGLNAELVKRVDEQTRLNVEFAKQTELAKNGQSIAEDQEKIATRESENARRSGVQAMSSKFAVQSLLEGESDTAALLAIEARRLAASNEADTAILQTMGRPRVLPALIHPGLRSIAVDRLGSRLLTTSRDGSVRLWDALRGTELARHEPPHKAMTAGALISPDGSMVFSGGDSPTLSALALRGAALETIPVIGENPHRKPITKILTSADGATLATADQDGVMAVWSVGADALRLQHVLTPHQNPLIDLAFTQDGTLLASAGGMDWFESIASPMRRY